MRERRGALHLLFLFSFASLHTHFVPRYLSFFLLHPTSAFFYSTTSFTSSIGSLCFYHLFLPRYLLSFFHNPPCFLFLYSRPSFPSSSFACFLLSSSFLRAHYYFCLYSLLFIPSLSFATSLSSSCTVLPLSFDSTISFTSFVFVFSSSFTSPHTHYPSLPLFLPLPSVFLFLTNIFFLPTYSSFFYSFLYSFPSFLSSSFACFLFSSSFLRAHCYFCLYSSLFIPTLSFVSSLSSSCAVLPLFRCFHHFIHLRFFFLYSPLLIPTLSLVTSLSSTTPYTSTFL